MTVKNAMRDPDGNILCRREKARVAEICDDCSGPIWPGDMMVKYDEHYRDGATPDSPMRSIIRHYCAPCGLLLEDSLTTTETLP